MQEDYSAKKEIYLRILCVFKKGSPPRWALIFLCVFPLPPHFATVALLPSISGRDGGECGKRKSLQEEQQGNREKEWE